ncbi:MAG: HAMP domain-containing histidine kinase [Leptospiraceae bacterium]|nr:HAMP domain-containing histidine kinase [Leptospiraceae bacterium]
MNDIQELEILLTGKIDSESSKKIKELANDMIESSLTDELLSLLNNLFSPRHLRTKDFSKTHLLSIVFSIYSTISLDEGINFAKSVIENIEPVPKFAISGLLRNCRKLNDYSIADNLINSKLLSKMDHFIAFEAIYYFENRGEEEKLKHILSVTEERYGNSKPIQETLLKFYLKYGLIDDANRIKNKLDKRLKLQDVSQTTIDKQIEKEVYDRFIELFRKNEEETRKALLSELINGITHEFGQPITNINWRLQYYKKTLQDPIAKEEVIKIFDLVLEETSRLNQLVKTIAPITSSKATKTTFNIVDVIKKRFNAYKETMEANHIIYEIHSNPDEISLYQDQIKFEQIINNLILNSIDALIEKDIPNREIHISIKLLVTDISIFFRDNGIGIPEDKREKIFIPYHTTKKKSKGEGLGLYIVFNLLKIMNGNISLDANYKNGALFKITIPKNQEEL